MEPSVLQAEPPKFSQPMFTAELFHSSYQPCGPPLDLFQQFHVLFLCWGHQNYMQHSRWDLKRTESPPLIWHKLIIKALIHVIFFMQLLT